MNLQNKNKNYPSGTHRKRLGRRGENGSHYSGVILTEWGCMSQKGRRETQKKGREQIMTEKYPIP